MAVSTFIQLDKKFKSTERFLVKWIIYLTGAHCFQFFKIHFVLSLQSFLFKLYTVQGLYYGLFSSSASFFLSFPLPRAWHYMHDSGTHFWKQYYRSVIFRSVFQKLDQSERHVTIDTCNQRDEETQPDKERAVEFRVMRRHVLTNKKKMTKTKTITKTLIEWPRTDFVILSMFS